MKDPAEETIDAYAKRTDTAVMRMTMAFALAGAVMDIAAHTLPSILFNGVGISMLWGLWIPLCFVVIPPVHYLCRHVQKLNSRIAKLELQLADRNAA